MCNGERVGAALAPTVRRVAALPEDDRKMALVAKEAKLCAISHNELSELRFRYRALKC